MEADRKKLGRRIQRARRRAGYRSAQAFADAIGLSYSSVAHAESGSDRAGKQVFDAIEDGLPDWPTGAIDRYLETGDPAALPDFGDESKAEPAAPVAPSATGGGDIEAQVAQMTPRELAERARMIELGTDPETAMRWMQWALAVQDAARRSDEGRGDQRDVG
ncbi:hypothetical protein [Amycolatopsis thermoflava]|uniref:hypothetical protein n=1 Tax=Amycolatopsis thermoflava TaxID=84480 RepID=UPI003F49D965